MKNKIYHKISLLLLVLFNFVVNAQTEVGELLPPAPETPQTGEIGGMIPSSPIDNYIGILLISAVGFVFYFIKHRKVNTIAK